MSLQPFLDALPVPAAVVGPDGVILAANAAFGERAGTPEPVGRPLPPGVGGRTAPIAGSAHTLVTFDQSPTVVDSFARFGQFAPFAVWLRDADSRYVYANPRYLWANPRMPPDYPGRHVTEVWPAETAGRFAANDHQVVSRRQVTEVVDTEDGPDGTPLTWHTVRFPLHGEDGRWYAAGIGIDVTARRRAEDARRTVERQLLQAQKLESLGVMAGGVAHDFNNLLTTILGNAGLARVHLPAGSPAADCLRKVEAAAGSAAALCQQMLAYSGRGQFVVGHVHLGELVRQMEPALRSVVPAGAELVLRVDEPAPPVRGDAAQMRQVILNLVANAADAVAEGGGTITVSTYALHSGREMLDARAETRHLNPGVYTVLEVADTGAGMDEGTRGRIFEPFFTTKFTGRGLGLSAVQGIARGHKGAVEVDSRPGRGSTFRVLLPAAGSERLAPAGGRRGDGKTLLVIDDEDEVRAVARKLLEAVGFTVLTATDGRDGLETFRNFHEQVSAVLLDLTMPPPDGRATLRAIRAVRADVPVVLWTGYGQPDAAAAVGTEPAVNVLRKPFTADELHTAVFAAVGH